MAFVLGLFCAVFCCGVCMLRAQDLYVSSRVYVRPNVSCRAYGMHHSIHSEKYHDHRGRHA
eukprot:m.490619 g.490619  ORF g.490619 m.490619 type:complete len:61 (+) comp28391_c0_seq1:49-231(+)